MIQFNLLPDVKLDYIKAQHVKRLVVSITLLVSITAIALLVILLAAEAFQKKHLSDLNKDIKTATSTLQTQQSINAILTVQHQLESLTTLHNGKPAVSYLFPYLNELTPASITISNLTTDFSQFTMTITGTADSLSSVNQYVDTLKLTNYTNSTVKSPTKAFKDVVLSSFGVNGSAKDPSQAASYGVTLSYDQAIFDITQPATLTVPNIVTHAQLQNASDLFKASPTTGSKQ